MWRRMDAGHMEGCSVGSVFFPCISSPSRLGSTVAGRQVVSVVSCVLALTRRRTSLRVCLLKATLRVSVKLHKGFTAIPRRPGNKAAQVYSHVSPGDTCFVVSYVCFSVTRVCMSVCVCSSTSVGPGRERDVLGPASRRHGSRCSGR